MSVFMISFSNNRNMELHLIFNVHFPWYWRQRASVKRASLPPSWVRWRTKRGRGQVTGWGSVLCVPVSALKLLFGWQDVHPYEKTCETIVPKGSLLVRMEEENRGPCIRWGPDHPWEGTFMRGLHIRNTVHVRRRCGLSSNYFDHLL